MNISHNIWKKKYFMKMYEVIYFAFGRYGSRFGPLSLFFHSPLFLLPIMWPWHLSHVITTAMPYCSYSRIPWSLLAGSNTCVDVVQFFFNLNCKTKEIFIMIVTYCIWKTMHSQPKRLSRKNLNCSIWNQTIREKPNHANA